MKGLNGWMRLLESSQSAVLSTLLKELDRITASDESSAIQLADVILKDASLTSSVIRIANSVRYNPSAQAVTTVSRAILNIGFKQIRSVCLSIKVLETVLKDSPSPVLVGMLAKTLHGATQAKSLCTDLPEYQQEEVFVASLLSHLSELLILGANEPEANELKKEINAKSSDQDKNRAAERILGVSVLRLSKTLMKQWRIEGIVHETLSLPDKPNVMVEAVLLGDEISRAALFGWDSPEFKEIVARVAEFKGSKVPEAKKLLMATADETAETILQYGQGILTEHIPTSQKGASSERKKTRSSDRDSVAAPLSPNSDIQLKILQELTSSMVGDFNINTIFKSILTGINKGVGLEHAALAIFDKTHQKLIAKYVTGRGTEKWRERFVLKYAKNHSGFLYNLFKQDQSIWVGNSEFQAISQYLTPEYERITGTNLFFIAPLTAKGKKVGIIYADLGETNRALNQSYFDGFNHFVQQTKLALNVIASR